MEIHGGSFLFFFQVHRSEMIRKFMHLERSEYWEASDADWLYSAIYDVDVITGKASLGSAKGSAKRL
jgi:hypothetical protein